VTPRAYYNENDPAAAHVLRTPVELNVIAPGEVDDRSIRDVSPDDLRGFAQCHFFAGGGLWSVAARLAGWPDGRPLWTGSCPCQGESLAGKRLGAADPRHLWPDFRRLIRARRPAVVMGEQVAAAAGTHWLDGTLSDLDADGYAARAVDIPACAVDAPNQRNRLYWAGVRDVDDDDDAGLEGQRRHVGHSGRRPNPAGPTAATDGGARDLQPHTDGGGRAGRPEGAQRRQVFGTPAQRPADELLADTDRDGKLLRPRRPEGLLGEGGVGARDVPDGRSFWSDYEWIVSPIDGKARRSKPGIRFLADGLPGRVDLWRIAGNAINASLAAEVIAALRETLDEM
jgi:DNA (cytosine-5)-methyltransferase 1